MKIGEIRGMNDQQLRGAELNVRESLFKTRMSRATGELSDNNTLRKLRRDLARILTVQGERTSNAASEEN